MTKHQQIEAQTKKTQSCWKKCNIRKWHIKGGFKPPVLNRTGKCSGCYNQDTKVIDPDCAACPVNEYAN